MKIDRQVGWICHELFLRSLFWANSSACVQGLIMRRLGVWAQVCLTVTSKLFSCVAHSRLIVTPKSAFATAPWRQQKKNLKSLRRTLTLSRAFQNQLQVPTPLSQKCSVYVERERERERVQEIENQKGVKEPSPEKALAEICMGISVCLYSVRHFCHIFILSTNT